MASLTLSDLSQVFQLRRDTVRVRQDLARATQELSSGKKSDLGKAVSGNYGPLAAIDRQLSALAAYDTNAKEASLFTDAAQIALGRLSDVSGELGPRLTSLTAVEIASVGSVFAQEARSAFDLSVSALNSTVAGRSLFAGAATDGAALAPAGDMFADLKAAIADAGATTAEAVRTAISDWFDGPGFAADGYSGSATRLSNFQVAEGREVAMSLKADDQVIRDQLKGLAMAAVLDDTVITDSAELAKLASFAGEAISANRSRLLAAQAGVGVSQARIEDSTAQNASERMALEIARNEIIAADPFEVATELQNLQVQLETIYTITARLSGLSLTNYLR